MKDEVENNCAKLEKQTKNTRIEIIILVRLISSCNTVKR